MDPQLLIEELQRLRLGEEGAESRVLFIISRSTLFLLSENDPSGDEESESLVIRARTRFIDGHETAYFFSSEAMLTEWCQNQGVPPYMVPVHGADMACILPQGTWIQLDPDYPYSTLLDPDKLQAVSSGAQNDGMELALAASSSQGFISPIKPEPSVSMPKLYRPVEADLETQIPAGPSKKRFIPRTHPTTLFAAPQGVKKEELTVEKQQSFTASRLKKVIRSDNTGGGE